MVLETGKHWKARKFYEKLGLKISVILKAHYGGGGFCCNGEGLGLIICPFFSKLKQYDNQSFSD